MLDAHNRRTLDLLRRISDAEPEEAQTQARRLTEMLALGLQASLMVRHAPDFVAEAFIGARLGEDRGAQYGVLPPGTDAAAIAARH